MASEQNITPYQPVDDEITLRDLILKVQGYWVEIRRNWWLVVLITLPFVGYFGYKAFTKPVRYTANLTFMLNAERGGVSGLASMLGGFGDLFGSGGSGGYQFETIIEIARSRRIISSALFEKINIDDKDDYFANHFIRIQEMHKVWKKDSLTRGFIFENSQTEHFTRKENKALISLYAHIVGGEGVPATLGTSINKKSGIMGLSLTTRNEMLSMALLNTIYDKMSSYYIQKSIQTQKETFDILAAKRDSINRVMNRSEYTGARLQDQAIGLVRRTDAVPTVRSQRQTQILALAYGEALKNAEMAEFALKNQTPLVSLLDAPIGPIKPDPSGRVKSILIGLFLGILFSSVFVIFRKIFQQAIY